RDATWGARTGFARDSRAELDGGQFAAVCAPMGPLLVIAGAGAGKTRTLVFRLARMLEQGIPPERILLLTFTNRAAKEMLDRAAELVSHLPGVDSRRLQGGTFHRLGHRILRRRAARRLPATPRGAPTPHRPPPPAAARRARRPHAFPRDPRRGGRARRRGSVQRRPGTVGGGGARPPGRRRGGDPLRGREHAAAP